MGQHDDLELCSRVEQAICPEGTWIDMAKMTEVERTVVLVCQVGGILDNGGFLYLFEGDLPQDPHYVETLRAYRRIGCDKAADAFEDVLDRCFSNGKPPRSSEQRLALYCSLPEDERERLDMQFVKANKQSIRRLAAFIRKNWAAIKSCHDQAGHPDGGEGVR